MKLEDVPNASDDKLINEWNLIVASKLSAFPRTVILTIAWLTIYFFWIRGLVLKLAFHFRPESKLLYEINQMMTKYLGFEYSVTHLLIDVIFTVFSLRILWTFYYPIFKENDIELLDRKNRESNDQ